MAWSGEGRWCVWVLVLAASVVGCSDDGEVGSETGEDGETGAELEPSAVVELALGSRHSCARLESGAVECWGANGAGQLGDGQPLVDSTHPVAVAGLEGEVIELAAGGGHTCALAEGGAVRCWGQDIAGQLGDGEGYVDQASPVGVLGLSANIEHIGAGSLTTCGMTDDKLLCWGGDWFGQVGDGEDRVNPAAPVLLDGLAGLPRAVDLDQRVGCVLLDSGEVQCWGQCWFGSLGIGLSEPDECYTVFGPEQPVQLAGSATAIAVGDVHACALLESGTVQCWGGNDHGQLGTGNFEGSSVPVDVILPGPATAIAAGSNFSCALLEAGDVRCWGENLDGQLGRGVVGESSPAPAPVVGLEHPVEAIAAGGWHACAITAGGSLSCWGADHRGQLGDGPPLASRNEAAPVLGLGEGLDGSVADEPGDPCADQPDPGLGVPASLGAPVVHWTTVDQYGEDFGLCELAGRPILLDISTSWCGPCQAMSAWLAGEAMDDDLAPWAVLRELVAEHRYHWLTILIEGPESEAATVEDAAAWHEQYPNEDVAVVIDPDGEMVPGQFWVSGYPGWAVIDASFRWAGIDGTSLLIASEKFGP